MVEPSKRNVASELVAVAVEVVVKQCCKCIQSRAEAVFEVVTVITVTRKEQKQNNAVTSTVGIKVK